MTFSSTHDSFNYFASGSECFSTSQCAESRYAWCTALLVAQFWAHEHNMNFFLKCTVPNICHRLSFKFVTYLFTLLLWLKILVERFIKNFIKILTKPSPFRQKAYSTIKVNLTTVNVLVTDQIFCKAPEIT